MNLTQQKREEGKERRKQHQWSIDGKGHSRVCRTKICILLPRKTKATIFTGNNSMKQQQCKSDEREMKKKSNRQLQLTTILAHFHACKHTNTQTHTRTHTFMCVSMVARLLATRLIADTSVHYNLLWQFITFRLANGCAFKCENKALNKALL